MYFFTKFTKKDNAQKLNSLSSNKILEIMHLHKASILLKGTLDERIDVSNNFKNLLEFFCRNKESFNPLYLISIIYSVS